MPKAVAALTAILLSIITAPVVGCGGSTESASDIGGCPTADWTGPWEQCADADWVERVVEVAGYEVKDGTGSALIAVGRGHSFYVWSTRNAVGGDEPSDDGVRTSWTSQGLTLWVEAGPGAADSKPSVDELAAVVAASRRLAPPPP